ncbi:MAG TPA: ATP-binding protein [Acidimicrobiales bacterium]|nr:ATP-binding protein [Acidimicrobiales bacterium]
MSLRRRVIIGVAAIALVLVATNVAISSTFSSFLHDRLDKQLIAASETVQGRRGLLGRPNEALTEYYIAVIEGGGIFTVASVLQADERPPPVIDLSQLAANVTGAGQARRPFTVPAASGDGKWRLVGVAGPDGRTAVVGLSLSELEATLAQVRWVQAVGTLAVLAALATVAWWMLRLGIDPLVSMAKTADEIAEGELSRRIDHVDERTEAGRLGAALNAMLGRIEEAFQEREESEARVRRFAADASHELRTPLTSIQGYTELWRAGGLQSKDELADAMRRMEDEAKRMGALVEDLLLLARIDQRRPLERAPVQLDAVVADSVRDAQAVEPDRPVTFDIAPVVVEGDEQRLRQVVGNLLANARVHTPPGTPVAVSLAARDGVARLQVADQGPGMAPEVADRVFERFYRADASRSRAAGGTGLGLAIVAAVVEAHSGSVRVESEAGQGSRFVVDLPLGRNGHPTTP